jgi:hypothetical protein
VFMSEVYMPLERTRGDTASVIKRDAPSLLNTRVQTFEVIDGLFSTVSKRWT